MKKKALIETAILGLERRELPALARATALQIDDDAGALLRALASTYLSEKAAQPLSASPALPEPDADTDFLPCSSHSSRHLSIMLQGMHEPALDEFLNTLAAARRSLPPQALPALLTRAAKDEKQARTILPLAGSRGAWLAAHIPRWNHLFVPPDTATWPVSTLNERIIILRQLRTTEPEAGLHLMLSTWKEDGLRERVRLLAELETGLSLADESFLEVCLEDPRKEIRQTAARLLAHLPGSALAARLSAYAESLFHFAGKDTWEIRPPDTLSPSWQRDGLESVNSRRGGAKAGLLQQLVSRIDPTRWEHVFSQSPTDILRRFEKSDWATPLFSGLTEAIATHRCTFWADALLLYWIASHTEAPDQPSIARIATLVSPKAYENCVLTHLKENRGIVSEQSIAYALLQNDSLAWPEGIVRPLFDGFREWLAQSPTQNCSMWHYRNMFKAGTYQCPSQLYEVLEKDWPMQSSIWYHWEKDIQYFLRGLAFRKEMREAIYAPESPV